MENTNNENIIVVDFIKRQEEKDEKERKRKDAIIYGNIIKRAYDLIPINQWPEDEPA